MRKVLIALALAVLAGAVGGWVLTEPQSLAAGALGPHTANFDNGRTMFFAGGCASCHVTPNQDDRSRLGGGLALTSPFGTFHVPNISPHPQDGIGSWSEADFVTAMTKGTSPDGQHYYPAFPYASYQRMRLEDVRDLFAYLKTLPPVAGRPPDHDLGFPYNLRRAVGLWKWLYLDGKPFAADPALPADVARGAYLVEGPGHCAECHSPRDDLGGIIPAQRFAGGPNPEGKGWVPNITPAGLKDWSADDIAYLLETGMTPEGDSIGGSMAPVIRNMEQLSPADRAAIAAYLKALPPVEGPKRREAGE